MTSEERTSTYTVSLCYDRRLYRQDLAGSIAHARMLEKQGIISEEEADLIVTRPDLHPSGHRGRLFRMA